MSLFDDVMPRYTQQETHHRTVSASTTAVWGALHSTPVSALSVSMALLRIRMGPKAWVDPSWSDSVAAESNQPALQAFAPREIDRIEGVELLLADIARYDFSSSRRPGISRSDRAVFEEFDAPGWTKVAMNFTVEEGSDGTLLTTRTRVATTDARTSLRFAAYWAMIKPGSALIRRDLLAAIASVAEESATVGG
ncbi:hypothetical protein [Rhodococcus sp. 1168]|uniref:hypothetical protein n=1 Tax=Rhodococcus sp. 1168 TaxID=2018041 RepID=UPI000A0C368E|nr:hypothetical protein [Rhodococcus sp. 1168]ORI21242.1 hypothetical protein BJI47_17615 [Rhodococcus sp. 1168]